MMLVDKESGKGYVEVNEHAHESKEYASKSLAGTALGLGIGGLALSLLGNGCGNNILNRLGFGCGCGKEYPNISKGLVIGDGKIKMDIPIFDKSIVLDTKDIEEFKNSFKQ